MKKDEFINSYNSIVKKQMSKLNSAYFNSVVKEESNNGEISNTALMGIALNESIKYSNDLLREVLLNVLPLED